jgi:hypothetical protein
MDPSPHSSSSIVPRYVPLEDRREEDLIQEEALSVIRLLKKRNAGGRVIKRENHITPKPLDLASGSEESDGEDDDVVFIEAPMQACPWQPWLISGGQVPRH